MSVYTSLYTTQIIHKALIHTELIGSWLIGFGLFHSKLHGGMLTMEGYIGGTHKPTNGSLGHCIPSVSYYVTFGRSKGST